MSPIGSSPETGVLAHSAHSISYNRLNEAVNATFFDGRFRLAPVYLNLEDELTAELASRVGTKQEDFPDLLAMTVRSTLRPAKRNPFEWHDQELEAWISLDCFEAPPSSALLCVLSLAAERMRNEGKFSAHNYYDRLFELLGIKDEAFKQRIRQNFGATVRYWTALNKWLTSNDYEYGRPTAQRVNSWPFVSFALSQALVREADRKRLHSMFIHFGLAPRERLTETEINLYLHEWMTGSRASEWLKRIWAEASLRPRVAAAARAELEHWDGSELRNGESSGPSTRSLNWVASVSNFPTPEFRLYLTAPPTPSDRAVRVTLAQGASQAAELAFSTCRNELTLTNTASGEFALLGPRKIDLSALLVGAFELKLLSQSSVTYKRSARPILPLAKLDTGAFYREVNRVSLLRPHLVICHQRWRDQVATFLSRHARPGFGIRDRMPGLPNQWIIFERVEIISIPEAEHRNLECLIPYSEECVVEISGGLQLGPTSWHADAPPEVTAACGDGDIRIELRQPNLEDKGKVLLTTPASPAAAELSLKDAGLTLGSDYIAAAVTESETIEKNFRLCSANMPRKSRASQTMQISYSLASPRGLFSADRESEIGPAGVPVIQGMRATPILDGLRESLANTLEDKSNAPGDPEDDQPGLEIGQAPAAGDACVLRAHHIWNCQPFNEGDTARAPMWMHCRDCGSRVLTRNRGKKKRPPALHKRATPKTLPSSTITARKEFEIGPDLLFDGVCYLNSGSWTGLTELASATNGERFGVRFTRALVDLGHIDATSDRRGIRVEEWACSPPVIVQTLTGTAFLAGFRSKDVIRKVREALSSFGIALETVIQGDAPSALIINNPETDLIREILDGIRDPYGRPLISCANPALTIAAASPPLSAVQASLPEIHVESYRDLEMFDPQSGKWKGAPDLRPAGAYRSSFAGRRYFYNDGSRLLKEGPFEVIKLLAARQRKVRLHSYDAESQSFISALGCDPPGLLRRALISCSGLLPRISEGRCYYGSVDQQLAALILKRLYT